MNIRTFLSFALELLASEIVSINCHRVGEQLEKTFLLCRLRALIGVPGSKKSIQSDIEAGVAQIEVVVEGYASIPCCCVAQSSDFRGFMRNDERVMWQLPLKLVSGFVQFKLFNFADITRLTSVSMVS